MTTETTKRRAKRRGSGEGCITLRADGRWSAIITVGYSSEGKRLRRTVYGETKKAVTEKLTRWQNQKLDRTLTATDTEKLGDYLTTWVKADTRLSPNTRKRYSGVIEKHIAPRIGGLKLAAVNAGTIEAFMAGLRDGGASEETVLYAYSILHRGYERLIEQRRIVLHPCTGLSRPRVERIKRQSLDASQADDLLQAAAGHRLQAVFVLAITAGLRQGEIFGLQWEDVDLDAGTLSVRHSLEEVAGQLRLKPPKSAAGLRSVKLSKIAVEALQQRWALAMAEDAVGVPYVFCDTEGKPLRKSNFARRVWEPIRKAAKIPEGTRFHDLRHTSATLLLKAGINAKVVQERLGHADIRLTLGTYSHVLGGMQDAAADAFDGMLAQKPAAGRQLVVKTEDSDATNENATAQTVAD